MKLYHFTCTHSAREIKADGFLRPWPQPVLANRRLVWLTDLESPLRQDVGLTSDTLHCDRMAYRISVGDAIAVRWTEYVRGLPTDVRRAARLLTFVSGLPMHWFVSEDRVPVLSVEAAA